MKIPDEKKDPFTYMRWKDMNLLNASDIERVLMLELDSLMLFKEYILEKSVWNRKDMRKFVKDISQRIEKELEVKQNGNKRRDKK